MKVLIDIPDRIHYGITNGFTVNGSEASQIVLEAIANGFVLDGLTNGEIIQTMFPDAKVEVCNEDADGNPHLYCVRGLDGVTFFTADWWNRKWGK